MSFRTQAWNARLFGLAVPVLVAWGLCSGATGVAAAAAPRMLQPLPSVGTIGVLGPSSASGPADTLVTVEVRQYASNAPTYALAAMTISPDQGGCASAKPLSSAPPFQLDPQRASDVQFHWPAALGHAQYWLCASPTSGTGPTAESLASQPFTVLTDAAPSVRITSPTAGIQAGASVTVTLANWLTSDATPPYQLNLLRQGSTGQSQTAIVTQVDQAQSNAATGTYVMTGTVSSYVASGNYAFVAQGECGRNPLGTGNLCAVSEQSAFVAITAAPSATAQASTTGGSRGIAPNEQRGISPLLLVGVPVGALLLILLVVGIALARRSRGNQRTSRRTRYQVDSRSVLPSRRAGRDVDPPDYRGTRGR